MNMFNYICLLLFSSAYGLSPQPTIKEKSKFSKFISEAEIKHGRVAMLSSVIIPTIELVNGNQLGINELSHQDLSFQLSLLGVFGLSEFCQLFKAYEFPMEPMKWFNMKDEHIPGDYNFDPLNLSKRIEFGSNTAKDIEKFNARVAMLAAFSILVQELCTDKTVIDTFVSGF